MVPLVENHVSCLKSIGEVFELDPLFYTACHSQLGVGIVKQIIKQDWTKDSTTQENSLWSAGQFLSKISPI